jgi:hypothetical protein
MLLFLPMETKPAANRIAERKLRDKQARRAQIISAARPIAELEGWSNVTVRRLSPSEGARADAGRAVHFPGMNRPCFFFDSDDTETAPSALLQITG